VTTWIVGDVHGCANELEALLAQIAPAVDDRVVLVGDLFDKGPDPVGVLRLVQRHRLDSVLGNHDVLVRDHGGHRLGRGPKPSYAASPYVPICLDRLEAQGALEEAVQLCASLPLHRFEAGWCVVHAGLHPKKGLDGTDERMATVLREYPPKVRGAKRWWEQWSGEHPVVFGHDARQGKLRHLLHGRPWCVGIDTGCVYGGALTAYALELDRFEQVAARREWHPKARS
jgi:hypothetical protein